MYEFRILAWVRVSIDRFKELPMDLDHRDTVKEGFVREVMKDLGGHVVFV